MEKGKYNSTHWARPFKHGRVFSWGQVVVTHLVSQLAPQWSTLVPWQPVCSTLSCVVAAPGWQVESPRPLLDGVALTRLNVLRYQVHVQTWHLGAINSGTISARMYCFVLIAHHCAQVLPFWSINFSLKTQKHFF